MNIADELFISKLSPAILKEYREQVQHCVHVCDMNPEHREQLLRFVAIGADLISERREASGS